MLKKPTMLIIFTSAAVFADSKSLKDISNYKSNSLSIIEVIPLNSPVKESSARFLLKAPTNFEIDEVSYQIRNAGKIFEKPRGYQKIVLQEGVNGKELKINVSHLSPGFYQLFVKVKDKSRKEHIFKTKYRDHAVFVIDNSLEVPMPDVKKNNATILGIDSDNDGIRDDVQIWMNENLSNLPAELKLAYRQYAIAVQLAMTTSGNKTESILATHSILKAQGCISHIAKALNMDLDKRNEVREQLDLMFRNTKERILSKLKLDENFHGQEIELLSREVECSF